MNKDIYVVDKLVIGNNHVIFNSGFLSIISQIYSNNIVFFSEKKHMHVLEGKIGHIENLTFHSYEESPLPSGLKKIYPWFKKKIGDILFIRSLYEKATQNVEAIFFTTLSITSMYYANRCSKKRTIPTYIVLHGEVEFLFIKKLRLLDKIRRQIYLQFICNLSSNLRLIVLSEVVKNKLQECFSIEDSSIVQMKHPILTPSIFSSEKKNDNTLIFAHIGTAMKKKSSNLFFSIAHKIKNQYPGTRFLQIGRIEKDLLSDLKPEIELITSSYDSSISQDEYEKNIQKIDYSIFTFDRENYVYRDSGAVMDSIAYRKPIIALKQDFFSFLFEVGGDIGFLCNNIYEMESTIIKLINSDSEFINRYEGQCLNLKKLSENYSTNFIRQQLKNQLLPDV